MKKIVLMGLLLVHFTLQAEVLHFSEVKEQDMYRENVIIKFPKDDLLPLNIDVLGDVIEMEEKNKNYLKIKKTFWLKMGEERVLVSFDGENFKHFKKVFRGRVDAKIDSENSSLGEAFVVLSLFLR